MLSRIVARRVPRAFASPVRMYSDARSEGSVAQSKGFNKKEKAHEDQYIRQHEAAQLEKLRADIAAKKQELNALEQKHDEIAKETK